MSDIKITIGADIANLQSNLAKAGGVTQDFANKATIANTKVGASYQSLFNLTEKLRVLQSNVFTEKDRGRIAAYNVQIKQTEAEIAKLNGLGTGGGFGAIGNGATKALSALRNIAYILPGIGIAGILAFATGPIIKFAESLFEASDAEKRLAEQTKFIQSFHEETNKNYGKEITSLKILRGAIESTTLPMATRLQAIKDLKKEFPGLFDGLTNEQLLTGKVGAAYDLAAQAILRKARASAAATELEKIASEKLDILQKAAERRAAADEKIRLARDQVTTRRGTGDAAGTQVTNTAAAQRFGIRLAHDIQAKADQDEIDELNKKQAFLLQIAVQGADQTIEIEKAKIEKLKKVRDAFRRDVEAKGDGAIDIKIPVSLNFSDTGAELGKQISGGGGAGAIADILIGGGVDDVTAELKKKMRELNDQAESIIQNGAQDIISSTAEGIGSALAGGDNVIPNLFGKLMSGIGKQIQDLGKFFIKSGITIKAAKEVFKKLLANPIAAVLVGIGLVALGALIQSQANKKYSASGFASGVRNFTGGTALVGERGPERVFLPSGSSVQPNNELSAYGGGQMVFIPDVRLQGTDLVIAFNRASAAMGRNN